MSRRCDEMEPLHSAWVDGELRTAERARLAAHLQRCARCRASIHALRVTQTMVRSLPVRALPSEIAAGPGEGETTRRRSGVAVIRVAARSVLAAFVAVTALGVAGFAAGSDQTPEQPQVRVPVDVYVADHLVRAIGGPVSTPALLESKP